MHAHTLSGKPWRIHLYSLSLSHTHLHSHLYTDAEATTPDGVSFSGIISDGAVLQRGVDTAAVVYGSVQGGVHAPASVSVTVAEEGATTYTVAASIVQMNATGGTLTWRAQLKPHAHYGGNLTLAAVCKTGCTDTNTTIVTDLTYGDVWFCAGQSNMELPMTHALTRNRTYEAIDQLSMYVVYPLPPSPPLPY